MSRIALLSAIVVLLMFITAFYFYSISPARIATHWNAAGEVDGYMDKIWIFLLPVVSLFLFLLLVYLPRLDPLHKNYKYFQKYYDGFILLLVLFMSFIFLLTSFWNFFQFNMIQLMMPAFAVLFFYLGIMMKHTRRNWFVGIRTPWTISSDRVWNETHRLGGNLFIISGVIAVLGVIFPSYFVWFLLVPVLISAIVPVVYSYVVFRRMRK